MRSIVVVALLVGCTIGCYADQLEQLVAEAKSTGSLEAAKALLEAADNLVQSRVDAINLEKKNNGWEKMMKDLCVIKEKTRQSRRYYSIQPETLQSIYKRAAHIQPPLAKAFNRDYCLVSYTGPKYYRPKYVKPDFEPECEDEIKSEIICPAFSKVSGVASTYAEPAFTQMKELWCGKQRKVQEQKKSGTHVEPMCSAEAVELLKRDAEVEADLTLELLKIEKVSQRAHELRMPIIEAMKEELKALKKARKTYEKEAGNSKDAVKQRKAKQALKLIEDKIAKLEENEEVKGKFDLFKPSTW